MMIRRLIALLRRFWLRKKMPSEQVILASAAKIPIVPTRFGLSLAFVLILLFIWSANHQLNLGYALTFLLSVLAMLSAGISVGQLARLSIHALPAAPAFVGDSALFPLIIKEHDGRARGGFILSNDWQEQFIAGLPAGGEMRVSIAQPALLRGRLHCAPLTLLTKHPAGWFVCWQWLLLKQSLWVYPQPLGTQPLPYQLHLQRGEAGQGQYGEDEFSYLTPYYYGAPLSRVVWKQFARGQMQIKQFSGQANERVSLDLADTHGDIEARLSQLCRWVLDVHAKGVAYSLRLDGQYLAYNRGEAHYHACLRALAQY